jgi:hypothetical protein
MIFVKGIASLGAAMLIGLSAPPAQAGYVVDLTQQGSNVVASGNGAIDLTGLTFVNGGFSSFPQLTPSGEFFDLLTGSGGQLLNVYKALTGPANFGPGTTTVGANSASGDLVGISDVFEVDSVSIGLYVPASYVSDSPLSDSATYNGQTFGSLGVTPGTYKWTWGSGANQNFTLVIGTVVPEPSTWAMMLLGFAGLGLMGYQSAGRPRRTARNA